MKTEPERGDRFKRPVVSIILPVYNQAKTLDRAVKSVLKQTFANWELIIVNDGSTDKTILVASLWLKQDPRIKFFDRPHFGVSKTINLGVTKAQGKIVTVLAADDYYLPEHLANNLDFFKKNPQADLVMSLAKILGSKFVVDIERPGKIIHLDKCVLGGTFFVKKEVFQAVGGRSVAYQFGTDYHFSNAIEKMGFNIHKRRTRTYVYDRTGKKSITHLTRKETILKA